MEEANRVTAYLKVTAEFYDSEATPETVRACVEQDLTDAGYEVEVMPFGRDNNVPGKIRRTIRLTPYNRKIKEFHVCVDKIAYFASAEGYEGTVITFINGKMEKVMESPETVKELMEKGKL